MLKKLIKYGNSYALVLNKSVLELLNIEGEDAVKLRVEGETLIIRGEKNTSEFENLMLDTDSAQIAKNKTVHDEKHDHLDSIMSTIRESRYQDPENAVKNSNAPEAFKAEFLQGMQAFKSLFSESNIDFENPEFKAAMTELEKAKPNMSTKEFKNKLLALRYQYFPSLRAIDKKAAEIGRTIDNQSESS
ncbi:AbrB/MazE/SpoVT family DNA-binding domain-containing protein [Gammaproteobacteria bacterium]|nr:AbrB/MazE/SpoVT family DNA-binding domain-containing protein [Gammaproteobacteria bacterium]